MRAVAKIYQMGPIQSQMLLNEEERSRSELGNDRVTRAEPDVAGFEDGGRAPAKEYGQPL